MDHPPEPDYELHELSQQVAVPQPQSFGFEMVGAPTEPPAYSQPDSFGFEMARSSTEPPAYPQSESFGFEMARSSTEPPPYRNNGQNESSQQATVSQLEPRRIGFSMSRRPSPRYAIDATHPNGSSFAQKFMLEDPKYHDKWAAVLFIIVLLLFAGLSGMILYGFQLITDIQDSGTIEAETLKLDYKILII
ncbi:hypothetical protein K3495_g9219 [Podosphaera aphanis]|nr:hypothetical protein K3495_g9219 [Podosphaera aphanis]